MLSIERLANPCVHRDDGAGHWREDARVAQLGLVAAQAGLGLADLRLEHPDARLGGVQLGPGGLHVFLAGGVTGGQALLALVFLARQRVLSLLLLQLGLEVFDGVAAGVEFGLLRGGVDFHQQLAFRDLIPGFDMDLADLPGRLGAHIDVPARLQGAECRDAVFNVTARYGDRGQGVAARRQHLPGGQRNEGNQARDSEQSASDGARAFHALVPARKFGPQLRGADCYTRKSPEYLGAYICRNSSVE